MSRLPNPDVGLRKVVLSRCALKVRLQALAEMAKPSQRLLVGLMRAEGTHPKVRLLASQRLRALQEARKREKRDRLLRQEAERILGGKCARPN